MVRETNLSTKDLISPLFLDQIHLKVGKIIVAFVFKSPDGNDPEFGADLGCRYGVSGFGPDERFFEFGMRPALLR